MKKRIVIKYPISKKHLNLAYHLQNLDGEIVDPSATELLHGYSTQNLNGIYKDYRFTIMVEHIPQEWWEEIEG